MKIQIIKYLNLKGEVVEMRKDHFRGNLPENIIKEYEVEIKDEGSVETSWLEELKRKYESGNYILLTPTCFNVWTVVQNPLWDCDNYKLIHNKHKDILEAYVKNPTVPIEKGLFTSMTGETEPSKWVDLEKDFIEDYNEEFWYRLKMKVLAWYEDESMIGKMIYDGLNMEYGFVLDIKYNTIKTNLGRKYSFSEISSYIRPATESEVLNLVYKPQSKVSKENPSTESNILGDLFLDNKAECLIENEQEFKLVYDFLDKTCCDKSLNRRLVEGQFDFSIYQEEFPIILSTPIFAENLFGWDNLEKRNFGKPLIKFDGKIFWKVSE